MDSFYKVKQGNKKIDIFIKDSKGVWIYQSSTRCWPTCKAAKRSYCRRYGIDDNLVKCSFAKK